MCSRIDSATEDSPSRGSTLVSGFMLIETSRCTTHLFLCFALVPEDARRGRNDEGCDDEREHGGVERRMKQEIGSAGGADGEGEEHAAHSAALVAGHAVVGEVTEQEDERRGRSGREDPADVEPANGRALDP